MEIQITTKEITTRIKANNLSYQVRPDLRYSHFFLGYDNEENATDALHTLSSMNIKASVADTNSPTGCGVFIYAQDNMSKEYQIQTV